MPGDPVHVDSLTPCGGHVNSLAVVESVSIHAQDSIMSTPSNMESFPSSLVERLWLRAYDDLKAEDAILVRNFEKILSHELDTSGGTDIRQTQLSHLIRAGLERTEKEARFKKGVGDILGVILKAKGVVDSAIQAVPHAALAWSSACLALEVRSRTKFKFFKLTSKDPRTSRNSHENKSRWHHLCRQSNGLVFKPGRPSPERSYCWRCRRCSTSDGKTSRRFI